MANKARAASSKEGKYGERNFRFEELDRLSDDFSDMLRANELKKRVKLWAARLQAQIL